MQYLNSANYVSATVYNSFNSVIQYFELAKVNKSLAEENARLKSPSELFLSETQESDSVSSLFIEVDSSYRYISARVINNSVNKALNYLTLNKGKKDGVKPDMGIVSTQGIVGLIVSVSESYSVGFSVLNSRWGVSAKLKNSGYFGPLAWNGEDYQMTELMEIPFHVELAVGDTVVTSSYSATFPEGVMIGTIQSFNKPDGENFYQIQVKLATNFKSVHYVDIIDNLDREELNRLNELMEDG